jgi:hypothetical protein
MRAKIVIIGGLAALCCLVVGMSALAATARVTKTDPPKIQGVAQVVVAEGVAPAAPKALVRAQQRNFRRWLASPQGGRQLSSVAKSCKPKPVYSKYTYSNLVGVVLWEYIQQVYFCHTGKEVTYFYRYRWGVVKSAIPVGDWSPWQFDGHINNSCGSEHCFKRGYRAPSRTAWTEGQFHVCLAKVVVCAYKTPTVSLTVYGDGSFSHKEEG